MRCGNGVYQGQAKAGAGNLLASRRPEKAFGQPLMMLFIYSRTVVRDDNLRDRPIDCEFDADMAQLGSELYGIVEKVRRRLEQQVAIAAWTM